jgi:hypothetical protein
MRSTFPWIGGLSLLRVFIHNQYVVADDEVKAETTADQMASLHRGVCIIIYLAPCGRIKSTTSQRVVLLWNTSDIPTTKLPFRRCFDSLTITETDSKYLLLVDGTSFPGEKQHYAQQKTLTTLINNHPGHLTPRLGPVDRSCHITQYDTDFF